MGLDMVEVMMGIEEAFDIEIPDEEAARLNTVGKLYAWVLGRLYPDPPRRCTSSTIFYQARRALMDLCGVGRRTIVPSTRIEHLLPARRRRAEWQELSRRMGTRLPDLELPRWMDWLLASLGLMLFLVCFAAYFISPIGVAIRYSLAGALFTWVAYRLATPFTICLPPECATVGGTVQVLARFKHHVNVRTGKSWDPNDAWETLRRIIAEQLQAPLESVTPDADLVRDLGAD